MTDIVEVKKLISKCLHGMDYKITADDLDFLMHTLSATNLEICEGWQPIETAPRDGTEIIGAEGNWSGQMSYDYGVWEIHGQQHDGYVEGDTAANPTRWRPLPTPPGDSK